MASEYIGDYLSGDTIDVLYYSFNSLGASTTPSSIGSVVVYKAGNVTETSVGVSAHSIGWDGRAGVNYVQIASTASGAFYSVGGDFEVIASGTSLDGQFVNIPVCRFSLQNRYEAGLIHRGIAAAGAASAISLDANARSSTSSFYDGAIVLLSKSTGAGQAREGTSYAGATGTLSLGRAWTTNPASGTSYELYAGQNSLTTTEIQSGLTQATADALLGRTISGGADGGRTVTSALRAIRNKVQIGASIGTVFEEDDSTSAWTASVTTAAHPLGTVDPA